MFSGAGRPSKEQIKQYDNLALSEIKKGASIAAVLALTPFVISFVKNLRS
ncbi:hypothetical protein SPOG_02185 [Schizosaccharomyces cryophilus OY26]|uniref:Uncharacterized protein n=1 Tax=Schizosaccharomyces cryophilus (strain OY26 / ATCC MYA-4695 / CBS 11777 / NBRC 106824 / NRRL Y48691) TaxID=653667 RepID=S9XGT8_SCHCR|nr:uncharacterized protein SPOG_02185 [Schizosaccharomyces cryophilus OY26]EPY52866.1 hypothetical protein SPOG_02185 [Schizosaccharomyces cryophilus OY26]